MDNEQPSDGRGPEWAELEARHKKEGVVRWHASRAPGATDEQVAAEMNRISRFMECDYNRVSSRLHGEAFVLRDSAHIQRKWDGETFVPVELSPMERARNRGRIALADLLIEAAALLERHGDKAHAAQAMGTRQGGNEVPSQDDSAVRQDAPDPTPDHTPAGGKP